MHGSLRRGSYVRKTGSVQRIPDESFNGRFRDECLNQEWFRNRREAAVIIESWRQHYNAVRPHSSLDYLTPNEYVKKIQSTSTQARAAVLN